MGPKILLVDDDRDLLEMLCSIFRRAGYIQEQCATLCLIEVSFLCAVRTRKRAFDMSEECRGRKVFGE